MYVPGPPTVPVFPDPVKNEPIFGPRKTPDQPNVAPGMQVLIAGPAAPGFVLKAAQRTAPEGHVTVVAGRQEVIDRLQAQLKSVALENVSYEVSVTYEPSSPEDTIDRAYLVSALNRTPDKLQTLRAIRRALKPDGLLGVDQRLFEFGWSGRGAVLSWGRQAGFEPAVTYGSPLHYMQVFWPDKDSETAPDDGGATC
jgi:ubiquinone/menaquinone biosynthesis C-methylase UbiE